MANKGLYGYSRDRTTGAPGKGAQSFGNPDGATSGGGAYAAGGDSPNGPNQGSNGPGPVNPVLNLFINQDWIDTTGGGQPGLSLSQLMTGQQQGDYQGGFISTLNISGSGAPARGYWVISGLGAQPVAAGQTADLCGPGFNFDLNSPNAVTVNLNTSIVRIYGGAGGGGTALAGVDITPGSIGNDALQLFGGPAVLNLNITNQVGANIGRFYGGGGGGGGGVGNGGDGQSPCGGGGGAAGWSPGAGGSAAGGANANVPGADGGVYDAANGGTDDPAVAGGLGGATGGTGAGDGGVLAGKGANSVTSGALGGFAIRRGGQPGNTVFLSGGGAAFVIGTVE